VTAKILLTLPEELLAEIDRRRGIAKRNSYIRYLLQAALSMPPEQLEEFVSKGVAEYLHGTDKR